MKLLLRFFVAFSILTTSVLYSITHYPADALAFAPTIQIGRGSIRDIDWHPSGDMLTVDTVTGAWIYTDTLADITHLDIQHAHFSPDGQWIAGVNERNQILLYDTQNFQPQITLSGHRNTVVQVAWHPTDPNRLATIEENGQLLVWDVGHRTSILRDRGMPNQKMLLWSPSGQYIAAMNRAGGIVVWDVPNRHHLITLPPMLPGSGSAWTDFFWDSEHVLARGWFGDGGGTETWDVVTGQPQTGPTRFYFNTGMEESLYSPNRRFLALSSGYYSSVTITDIATNEVIQSLPENLGWNGYTMWSPDSKKLATSGSYDNLIVWDVEHNQLLGSNTIHAMFSTHVSWRDDGKIIATAGNTPDAHLWDGATGVLLATLSAHNNPIQELAWQPDGSLLVTVSQELLAFSGTDQYLNLWETVQLDERPQPLLTIHFPEPIISAAWSPDGSKLLITGNQQSVYIWDVQLQQIIYQFDVEPLFGWCCETLFAATWNYDGNSFLLPHSSSGNGGAVALVNARTGKLMNGGSPNYASTYVWTPDNDLIWANWNSYGCGGAPPEIYNVRMGVGYSRFANISLLPSLHIPSEMPAMPATVARAVFDPVGNYLAGIDRENHLLAWEVATGVEVLHINDVENVIWSPNSEMLATFHPDYSIRVTHRDSARIYGTFALTSPHWKNALTFSPDSRRIAVIHDGVLTIYDSTPDCMASIFRPFFGGEAYCEA